MACTRTSPCLHRSKAPTFPVAAGLRPMAAPRFAVALTLNPHSHSSTHGVPWMPSVALHRPRRHLAPAAAGHHDHGLALLHAPPRCLPARTQASTTTALCNREPSIGLASIRTVAPHARSQTCTTPTVALAAWSPAPRVCTRALAQTPSPRPSRSHSPWQTRRRGPLMVATTHLGTALARASTAWHHPRPPWP